MRLLTKEEAGAGEFPALPNSTKDNHPPFTPDAAPTQGGTSVGLCFVAAVLREPKKQSAWLAPCIEILADLQVELGATRDLNFTLDIRHAERLFLKAVV